MINDKILAYTAGIIDGEGCIGIQKQKICGEMKSPHYRQFVEVKNTDERLIDFLCENFDGHKAIENRKTVNHKIVYKWYADSNRATEFLKMIYPYLVMKKEQVDVVMELRTTFGHGFHREVPKAILDFRKACYEKLRYIHGQYSSKGLWLDKKDAI